MSLIHVRVVFLLGDQWTAVFLTRAPFLCMHLQYQCSFSSFVHCMHSSWRMGRGEWVRLAHFVTVFGKQEMQIQIQENGETRHEREV